MSRRTSWCGSNGQVKSAHDSFIGAPFRIARGGACSPIPHCRRTPTPGSASRGPIKAIVVDHVFEHLNAQTYPTRWLHPTVDGLDRRGDQVVLHRIAQRLDLEQAAGG